MASYIGSKRRISKDIYNIITSVVKDDTLKFYDLFCGGLSVSLQFSNTHEVYSNDICEELIYLWDHIKHNEISYTHKTKEEFELLKTQTENSFEKSFWIIYGTFNCIFMGNYCRPRTNGRHDPVSRFNTIKKLQPQIKKIHLFTCMDYREFVHLKNSIIYLDPPYKNTVNKYCDTFDHDEMYDFIKHVSKNNHVFLSEITPPPIDHVVVFEKSIKNKWNNTEMIEKLFYFPKNLNRALDI